MANVSAPLRKTIQARSADELAWIEEQWALEKTEEGADEWPTVEQRPTGGLQDIISARFAWEALSTPARHLLHQMIALRITDGVPHADLQKLGELNDAQFAAVLGELERSLMLIETRPDAKVRQRLEVHERRIDLVLSIPQDFREMFATIDREIYGPDGDRTKMKLVDALAALGLEKLQVISALAAISGGTPGLGFYTTARNVGSLASSLAGKLVQAEVIEAIWEKLDATEQQICRWLCRADGSAEVAQIQAALKLSRTDFAHYVRRLENYGLVFDTFSGQEHKVFIGRGIFKVLRKFIGELDALREQTARTPVKSELEAAPPVVHQAHSQLLYDLAIIVNAAYQMVIEPTQAGKVPKRVANKILPLLHGNRPTYYENADSYLDMVFSIATSLELLALEQRTGQKARYVPGPKLAEWANLPAFEQTRRLLVCWEEARDRGWSDVAGVNYRPSNYGFGYYIESHAAREGLLEYLADHCQPGQWYALVPFLQTIKTNELFLLREHSRYTAYSSMRNRKEVLANWEHSDAEIITGMLTSTLHELGLVSLGFSADPSAEASKKRNPDAFQFSELAAQAIWNEQIAGPAAHTAAHGHTLIVQPNFELLLLQPDYPTLYKLLPFTRVEQVELVSRLTLTQESVRRGVEAGCGIEQIVNTLQEHSQKELPQNVLYTLQDWSRLYKNATVSQVILLEVSSESIADEICASSKLRALELRRLGPLAIAVGGQVSLQVLRTTLEKEGVILHIEGDILSVREFAATSGYGRRK